jgi:hypothetical protein
VAIINFDYFEHYFKNSEKLNALGKISKVLQIVYGVFCMTKNTDNFRDLLRFAA